MKLMLSIVIEIGGINRISDTRDIVLDLCASVLCNLNGMLAIAMFANTNAGDFPLNYHREFIKLLIDIAQSKCINCNTGYTALGSHSGNSHHILRTNHLIKFMRCILTNHIQHVTAAYSLKGRKT